MRIIPIASGKGGVGKSLVSANLAIAFAQAGQRENAVISQRNHPVDIHIFHNAHATIAWPQQTLL